MNTVALGLFGLGLIASGAIALILLIDHRRKLNREDDEID